MNIGKFHCMDKADTVKSRYLAKSIWKYQLLLYL